MDKDWSSSLDQFEKAIKAFDAITEESYYGYNLKSVMATNPDLTDAVMKLADRARVARLASKTKNTP